MTTPSSTSSWRHANRSIGALLLAAALALASCSSTLGDAFDDASIVARVKTALLNDLQVGRRGIEVASSRGYVRLSGRIQIEDEVAQAVLIASSVSGVLDVTSRLLVIP